MATFTFRCKQCQTEFDAVCTINERENIVCPECQSKDKEQIIKNNNMTIKRRIAAANTCGEDLDICSRYCSHDNSDCEECN